MKHLHWATLALAVAAAGCFHAVGEQECDDAHPCGSGWQCVAGVCNPPGDTGGGTGVGGGSNVGGGGGSNVGGGGSNVGGGGSSVGGGTGTGGGSNVGGGGGSNVGGGGGSNVGGGGGSNVGGGGAVGGGSGTGGGFACPGCVDSAGQCEPGVTNAACGTKGQACLSCGSPAACVNGACVVGQCNAGNCAGCCVGGICTGGTSAAACGSGGAQCQDCSLGGGFCQNGACSGGSSCNPMSCTGCCVGNFCTLGNTAAACGAGGLACMSCPPGAVCQNGFCQMGSGCGPATCGGCCDANGTCRMGQSNNRCGAGGAQCQACAMGEQCAMGFCIGGSTDGGMGTVPVGSACTAQSDCQPPTSHLCVRENDPQFGQTGFTGGYCTQLCGGMQCSAGSTCVGHTFNTPNGGFSLSLCLAQCTQVAVGQGDCRTGYVCEKDPSGTAGGYCTPRCDNVNVGCSSGQQCDPTSGYCQ